MSSIHRERPYCLWSIIIDKSIECSPGTEKGRRCLYVSIRRDATPQGQRGILHTMCLLTVIYGSSRFVCLCLVLCVCVYVWMCVILCVSVYVCVCLLANLFWWASFGKKYLPLSSSINNPTPFSNFYISIIFLI